MKSAILVIVAVVICLIACILVFKRGKKFSASLEEVEAVCKKRIKCKDVNYVAKGNKRKEVIVNKECNIWEYTYHKKKYKVEKLWEYDKKDWPDVGDKMSIVVNENNPNDFKFILNENGGVGDVIKKRTFIEKTWFELITLALQIAAFITLPSITLNIHPIFTVVVLFASSLFISGILGIFSRRWVKFIYPFFVGLVFLPFVFIYFNSSAMVYCIWFIIINYFGIGLGILLSSLIRDYLRKRKIREVSEIEENYVEDEVKTEGKEVKEVKEEVKTDSLVERIKENIKSSEPVEVMGKVDEDVDDKTVMNSSTYEVDVAKEHERELERMCGIETVEEKEKKR